MNPSPNSGPNDASVVCACGEDYLKSVGQEASTIRVRVQQLTGKPAPYLIQHGPGPTKTISSADIAEWSQKRLTPLEERTAKPIRACEIWRADQPKFQQLPQQVQDTGRSNAAVQNLIAERDEASQRDRQLVSQQNWARTSANVQLHNQLMGQIRDLQNRIGKAGVQHQAAAKTANDLQRRFENESRAAKDDTYSEAQIATSGLWIAEVEEIASEIDEINGEQEAFDYQAFKNFDAEMKKIADKWHPIWQKQMDASPDKNAMTVDANGPRQDSLPFAVPADQAQSGKINALLAREHELARTLVERRNRLAQDLQRWAVFSSRDSWPAAGTPTIRGDIETNRYVLAYSFEEFTHLLLDPQEPHGNAPNAEANSIYGKKQLVYFPPMDASGQRTDGLGVAVPRFSLAVQPIRAFYGEPYFFGVTFSANFAAEEKTFWDAHSDWMHWNGQIPDGIQAFDYDRGIPVDIRDALIPAPRGSPVLLTFDPFKPENGERVMYASGADKTQRP